LSIIKNPNPQGIFAILSARTDIANMRIRNDMSTASKQLEVKTSPPSSKRSTPRLPHERDESEDSQASQPGPERDDIKQAYRDLQNGQVDTDLRESRGVDAVMNKTPGPSPVNPRDAKPPGNRK
jgi:hypothetical protein